MALVHWDPLRGLRRRDDAFEDLFRDFFRRSEGNGEMIEPAAEVAETDRDVTVKLEVPGVDKEHVNITVTDDGLTIRGEVRKEAEEKRKNFYRQEIRYGMFERTMRLPAEVDAAKATAELKNGILKVTLPKSGQPKARTIKVNVG